MLNYFGIPNLIYTVYIYIYYFYMKNDSVFFIKKKNVYMI